MTDEPKEDPMVISVLDLIAKHRDDLGLPAHVLLTGILVGVFEGLAKVYGEAEVRAAFVTVAQGGPYDPSLHHPDIRQAKPAGNA